jgi:hypothetical protein
MNTFGGALNLSSLYENQTSPSIYFIYFGAIKSNVDLFEDVK